MHLSLSLMFGSRIGGALKPSWVPDDAVAAYNALTDRIFGGSKSFSRSSTALWNPTGVYQEYATNVLRRADGVGALVEPPSTNKCTNFNANPTDLTGMVKASYAAATLTIVDDSEALAAAGLSTICTSGIVYKLDNSAGTGNALVAVEGVTGNTNAHVVSVYWRGSGEARLRSNSTDQPRHILPNAYTRQAHDFTPSGTTQQLMIWASAGAVVYFILNQLEELPSATTPIITSGATATRAGDELTLTPTSGAALDWHARYDDDSEGVIASGVTGAHLIDPATLTRPGVKMIWATEAA